MFSGLVEELGEVKKITRGAAPVIGVKAGKVLKNLEVGDSISVNGVCLTVVFRSGDIFEADVMPETLRRTDLGTLRVGDKVNLERPLKLGDRLGGHLVSGHIDGVGTIIKKVREKNAFLLRIASSKELLRYMIEKGSVAVDGVSLTVIDSGNGSFSVSIIPHTAEITTLGIKGAGAKVNIEVDMMGKYVERFLKERR